MGWWSSFDPAEVEADFARIAAAGLDSVRVFLTWEDFQPAPGLVDREMLGRLVVVADLAAGLGLALIPTLFTGHMSGVNWIPPWALGGADGDPRFRVVSGGTVVRRGLRNWYSRSGGRRRSGSPCHGGCRCPRRARGGLGLGPRQRELQLCRPAEQPVGPRVACPPELGDSQGRRDRPSSRSGCTWKTSRRTVGSGRARPPGYASSSRCTATRSTHAGRAVRPTLSFSRSWPA